MEKMAACQDQRVKSRHESISQTYLHNRPTPSIRHNNRLLLLKNDPPNRLSRLAQLSNQRTRAQIPDLDAAVTTTTHDARFVELEGRDAVVVRGQPVDRDVAVEGPDADGAVGAAGYEDGVAELDLPD